MPRPGDPVKRRRLHDIASVSAKRRGRKYLVMAR